MLRMCFEVFKFFALIGSIALTSQGSPPKALWQLGAVVNFLKTTADVVIYRERAVQFARFGFSERKIRPQPAREHRLSEITQKQRWQHHPQCKQQRVDNCCRKIRSATQFKHHTQRLLKLPEDSRYYPKTRDHVADRPDYLKF